MALRLFDAFNAMGVEAYLISIDRNQEIPLSFDIEREKYLKKRTIFLSNSDVHWNPLSKVLMGSYHWLKLQWIVKKQGLDLLLSFMERANILNLITLIPKRKIISIRIHLTEDLSVKAPIKRLLIEFVYHFFLHRAGKVNFNSFEAAQDFRKRFPVKDRQISIINNFCDINKIRSLAEKDIPSEYKAFYDGLIVITAGRLFHTKGHIHLLRAFKFISDKISGVKLIILGEGPLEEDLKVAVKKLHITKQVLFPGFQNNPYPWMVRADVFVLSSKEEGFPNALLEAIVLGLPVISADCPSGPRELLAPETNPLSKTSSIEFAPFGILTAPLNDSRKIKDVLKPLTSKEQFMAKAMEIMLKNDKMREDYSRAALERSKNFSVEKIFPQWIKMLDSTQ